MTAEEFFEKYPEVAVAFSGGVDSAYLLYLASVHAKKVRAFYVKTPFQPQFERKDAKRLAKELGVALIEIPVHILEEEEVVGNPPERCYFCKKKIMGAIKEAAQKEGLTVLCDGSNASDDAGERPGMQALSELAVLSPLRLLGLTKEEIRRLSKEAGLFTHDKPAYACLATRIPTGVRITEEALAKTEAAEAVLRNAGFTDFRVRMTECKDARIEVKGGQMPLLLEKREEIVAALKPLYRKICLDLEFR